MPKKVSIIFCAELRDDLNCKMSCLVSKIMMSVIAACLTRIVQTGDEERIANWASSMSSMIRFFENIPEKFEALSSIRWTTELQIFPYFMNW